MSGFLKRNTANPAGGVNPASSPNVGQYGWTSYDAANVNQLIQYVEMARDAATKAKDSADYVESKFSELSAFIDYIEQIYEQIGPIFNDIDAIYTDIKIKHQQVMNAQVQTEAALMTSVEAAHRSEVAATLAKRDADLAIASAAESKASADASEQSQIKAAEIAEELRKGQVYRGTWNIEANNGYPAKPDTNSVWDVTLNEGSASFRTPDNILWFWGDRLLFLKDEDKFSQIESGSGVLSVNGKSGAVTLTATDVDALPIAGGKLTGLLHVPNALVVEGGPNRWVTVEHDAADMGYISHKDSTGSAYRTIEFNGDRSVNVVGNLSEAGKRVYSPNNKPTAADVGALSTGGGVLTATLNIKAPSSHLRFTETDNADKQWHQEVANGDLRFTETNVAQRFVLKAGGGGDLTGNLSVSGLVTSSVQPTESNHLTRFDYVNAAIKVVDDKVEALDFSGFMPKSGGEFTGRVTLAPGTGGNIGSLVVPDKATIMYRDGSYSWIHSYAEGNALKWGSGGGPITELMALGTSGLLETTGPQYSRTGHIARSSDGESWIGMETPDGVAPYISSKTSAEGATSIAMRFGKSEVSVESDKRFAASTFRVADNAGLKFTPFSDLRGVSWGMGMDPANGVLGVHKYVDGVWSGGPMEFMANGDVHLNSALVSNSAIISNGGYISATRNSNPMLELHSPGVAAAIMYLPAADRLRFGSSNGAGGETGWYAEMQSEATYFQRSVRPNTTSVSWGEFSNGTGGIVDREDIKHVVGGQWYPMLTSSSYVSPSQGYITRWSLGYYRDTDASNGSIVFNMTGDGLISNSQRFKIASTGAIQMEATHDGGHWSIQSGGHLYGSIFGGYGNMVAWCQASFAPISDEKLKKNIKPATKSALDDVAKIEFKSYEWDEDTKVANMEPTKIGLVAQEMEAIDPSYTRDIETFKPDGSVDTSVKGLDVTNMLALALKAIQEQQVQINELKEKLNEFILK